MHWWFPPNASSYGGEVDSLFYLILYITGAVFLIVEVALLIFLFRYRHRAGRTADYVEGSTTAEIIWTSIPAVVVVFLALFSQRLWSKMKDPSRAPRDAVPIAIHVKQFEWQFTTPGPDGRLGTEDDIFRKNELNLEVNRSYSATMTSQDVIHSFFVPAFRLKQDAVPGMTVRVWFRPTETGTYEIACAELCGIGHYRMGGRAIVRSAEGFAAWQARASAGAAASADSTTESGKGGS